MELFIFICGLCIILYPLVIKRSQRNFVDYYLLFCLFFDLSSVFVDAKSSRFILSQDILMLGYTCYYLFSNSLSVFKVNPGINWLVFLFVCINFFIPVIQHGDSFKSSFISTIQITSSLSILPIAIHHYATKGSIINLIKNSWAFTILLLSAVFLFTILGIDSNYEMLDGSMKETVASMSGRIHFGNIDVKGGFTYIAFLVVLFPLFFMVKTGRRLFIYIALGVLLLFILLSFKRMSLLIVFVAFIIWYSSSFYRRSKKITFVVTFSFALILSLIFFNLDQFIAERINVRGGSEAIGIEATRGDIRLYELIYIYTNSSLTEKILGSSSTNTISISLNSMQYVDWTVHNQYAQYLLKMGFTGLLIYFGLILRVWRFSSKIYKQGVSDIGQNKLDHALWITFRILLITFVMAGMIGGLDKISLRGIVFIYLGAISGHFYKSHTVHKRI